MIFLTTENAERAEFFPPRRREDAKRIKSHRCTQMDADLWLKTLSSLRAFASLRLNFIFKKTLYIAVIAVSAVVLPLSSFACECSEMTPERSLAVIENAEFIFAGTVVALEQPEQPLKNFDYTAPMPVARNPLYAKVRLKINEPFKGGAADDRVNAYIDTLSECGQLMEIGDAALFILNRDDKALIQSDSCSDPLPAHWDELKAGKFRK